MRKYSIKEFVFFKHQEIFQRASSCLKFLLQHSEDSVQTQFLEVYQFKEDIKASININKNKGYLQLKIILLANLLPYKIRSRYLVMVILKKHFKLIGLEMQLVKINIFNGEISVESRFQFSQYLQFIKNKSKKITYLESLIKQELFACISHLKVLFQNLFQKEHTKNNKHQEIFNQLQIIKNIYSVQSNFEISNTRTSIEIFLEKTQAQKKQLQQVQKSIQLLDFNHSSFDLYYLQYLKDFSYKKNYFLVESYRIIEQHKQIGENEIPNIQSIEDFIFNAVQIKINNLMKKPVGSGGMCQIYLANAELNFVNSVNFQQYEVVKEQREKLIAIKALRPQLKQNYSHKIQHERKILSFLKGQSAIYLPKYYGVQQGKQLSDTIIMQYIKGAELDQYVRQNKETISLQTKLFLLLNVIHGLKILSRQKVVHLDLKPCNIMVTNNLFTKIIDYGQAYHERIYSKNYQPGYTFPYSAPQVIRMNVLQSMNIQYPIDYSEKQDVFAIGHIIAEIIFDSKIYKFSRQKYSDVYFDGNHLNYLYFSPERLDDYGHLKEMEFIFMLFLRCIDGQVDKRPFVDWIGSIIKQNLRTQSNFH